MIGLIFGPPGSGKGTQASRIQHEQHERKPQRFPLIGALNGRPGAVDAALANAAGFAPLLTFPGMGLSKSHSWLRFGGGLNRPSRDRDKPGRQRHAGIVK